MTLAWSALESMRRRRIHPNAVTAAVSHSIVARAQPLQIGLLDNSDNESDTTDNADK